MAQEKEAPFVPTLADKVAQALRDSQLWQVSPALGARLIAKVLAPAIALSATGRDGVEPVISAIERRLVPQLETWLRAKQIEREDQVRADIAAGATYFGRQSNTHILTGLLIEEFTRVIEVKV